MPHADAFETILRLESALGASWPQIRKSHADTVNLHNRLQEAVADLTGEDAAIVVFGSLGRHEVTGDSDID